MKNAGIFPQVILTALILLRMVVEMKAAVEKPKAAEALVHFLAAVIKWGVVFSLLYFGRFYTIPA